MDALSSVSQSAARDHSYHLGCSANTQISFLPPNDPKRVGFFFLNHCAKHLKYLNPNEDHKMYPCFPKSLMVPI